MRAGQPADRRNPCSAGVHQVQVQTLSANEISKQYRAFAPPDGRVGMFDPSAGWVDVERALPFSLQQARCVGATIMLNCAVGGWRADNSAIQI
jgi:N-methyl-L-tryptophan oxidase